LQTQIEALRGAIIYIGSVSLPTSQVTQAALNARAQELGKYPPETGYVLIDSDANDWWFDGAAWVNIGYYEIATATNSSKGVVMGNDVDLGVVVDASGKMGVKNLTTALAGKQDKLTAGDPMRLMKADLSHTQGYADFAHELTGAYANAGSVPGATGYFITTSANKLNANIIAQNGCNLYMKAGTRNDAGLYFSFPSEWKEFAQKTDIPNHGNWVNVAVTPGNKIASVNFIQCEVNNLIKLARLSFNFKIRNENVSQMDRILTLSGVAVPLESIQFANASVSGDNSAYYGTRVFFIEQAAPPNQGLHLYFSDFGEAVSVSNRHISGHLIFRTT